MTADREHKPKKPPPPDDNDAEQPRKRAEKVHVKDILDEIDDLLEENAEAFVKAFVQKGGQ